ncbi:MBL fold metallo-hydrolase [Aquimarina brevivitae]|uniref:L-ascorbate metabolism protein UlaG (Beta-lactamase superfamily) n=1 Tax=Aquimarina brevivitae TaxID=323412 RepID=A0A4Q7P1Z2_9FLAO|nr:MBL fold metallo-hydrolase [Aquimarina brevivitae]RZS93893.1 L-ascorbate metabolism protein UlaG (beta-lactamase superfamily) [Aquimarina brevivitae]
MLIRYSTLCILFLALLGCQENKKKESDTKEQPAKEEVIETSQKEAAVEVIPISHASAVIKSGNKAMFIDPTGGPTPYASYKTPDIVFITDIHGDHMNISTLDSLNLENSKLIVPQAVAEKLPAAYTDQIVIINNGETKEIDGITVEAIPMYNLREEALKFHEKGRGNGYVLTIDGERIYFSGDTEDIAEMRNLKNIDRAYVCMNLPYTMTVDKAADAVLDFKPKQVYPYHYRGSGGLSDVSKFKEIVTNGNPDIEVVQLDWYPNRD